ncbi:uncharacterized protein A4U43_C01F1850 [Asparagus officinalis]|uniref:Protein kinase domain-containing protein n=2 Tax=Asparagus officinalis TaxID=4686 RepID=A0A5P1FQK7_ASPOF|nr:uncharacterized protein A4U43_C01F1850 [Asparagus officinalis]
MKPARISSSFLLLLLLVLVLVLPSAKSSRATSVNNPQLNCAPPPTHHVLGYALQLPPSCPPSFSFRPQAPHLQSPSLLNSLLVLQPHPSSSDPPPANGLVTLPRHLPPAREPYYQPQRDYRIKPRARLLRHRQRHLPWASPLAKAMIRPEPLSTTPGGWPLGRAHVPIAAAADPEQRRAGAKYLLTYLVTWRGTDDCPPSPRGSADRAIGAVLPRRQLAGLWRRHLTFPTLLIPLAHANEQSVQAPGRRRRLGGTEKRRASVKRGDGVRGAFLAKKWVFVGVGIGAGFVVLCGLLGWYYFCCFRLRGRQLLGDMPVQQAKKAGVSTSSEYGALSGKASTGTFMSSEIRGFVEALVVYRFSDLEKATGFFAEDHRIRGYRAVINGDDAAVKRINGDVSSEIRILKRINHSNVVRLSGFCVHEGNTYLVYEFAENGALSDWLHHGKGSVDRVLSWKHRVRVAYDVADGLNYLHNYTDPPYIHKNLKSSNILLDSEFRAKLGNFGLARAVEEEEKGLQLTRHVVGTQGYMAPEYLEHGLITPKLDVFAFGVIILELLSGKEAIFAKDGDNKGEVLLWASIREVMKGENVRSQVRDFIDPCLGNEYPFDLAFAMAEVALRCVVVEPGSRPAMAEVVTSLSAIYNSTLDWDPSDVGNMSSVVRGR